MRKRVVIGAIAVMVIGVAAYVFSEPRAGSVEYHEKQFRKIYNDGRAGRIGQMILRFGPDRLKHAYLRKRGSRLNFHRNALVERGYLVRKTFVLSFRSAQQAGTDVYNSMLNMTQYEEDKCMYGTVDGGTTNTIVVIDTSKRMERLSDFVEFIDVPERK